MPHSFRNLSVRLLAAASLAIAAPLSIAHGSPDVNWSISIGTPPVYAPPAAVYMQPAPVYVQPQPVYVQPAPVVAAPVITYGQPYYVREVGPERFRHHHWRHDHRRD